MDFFKQLAEIGMEDVLIQVKTGEDGSVTAFITPKTTATDSAVKMLVPFNLTGTPEELDTVFFSTLKTPMQQTQEWFNNLKAYEATLDKAKKASAETTAKKPATTKEEKPAAPTKEDKAKLAKIEKAVKALDTFVAPFIAAIQWRNNKLKVRSLLNAIFELDAQNARYLEVKAIFEEHTAEPMMFQPESAEQVIEETANTEIISIVETPTAKISEENTSSEMDVVIILETEQKPAIGEGENVISQPIEELIAEIEKPIAEKFTGTGSDPIVYEERCHQLSSLGFIEDSIAWVGEGGFEVKKTIIREHTKEYWDALIVGIQDSMKPKAEIKPEIVAAPVVEEKVMEKPKTLPQTEQPVADTTKVIQMPSEEKPINALSPMQQRVINRTNELVSFGMKHDGGMLHQGHGIDVHIVDIRTMTDEKWMSIIERIENAVMNSGSENTSASPVETIIEPTTEQLYNEVVERVSDGAIPGPTAPSIEAPNLLDDKMPIQ